MPHPQKELSQTFANMNIIGKTGGAITSATYTARTTDENVTSIGGNYSYSTLSSFKTRSNFRNGWKKNGSVGGLQWC